MLYPQAINVTPLSGYKLLVAFDNGENRVFDVNPYLRGDWFSELRDANVFNAVTVSGYSVAWPDGQDIAPDCLYVNSVRVNGPE